MKTIILGRCEMCAELTNVSPIKFYCVECKTHHIWDLCEKCESGFYAMDGVWARVPEGVVLLKKTSSYLRIFYPDKKNPGG